MSIDGVIEVFAVPTMGQRIVLDNGLTAIVRLVDTAGETCLLETRAGPLNVLYWVIV